MRLALRNLESSTHSRGARVSAEQSGMDFPKFAHTYYAYIILRMKELAQVEWYLKAFGNPLRLGAIYVCHVMCGIKGDALFINVMPVLQVFQRQLLRQLRQGDLPAR